ncbi:MAG: hypothetical protein KIS76_12775 [Pyrinomonadaceae bacterium]|nr:hypothetical protein [Pyrinomonadaceae bacterium]
MNYGLTKDQLARIPEETKNEIVAAVRKGLSYTSVMRNGIVIIYGESHMPHVKRLIRKTDIELRSFSIIQQTGADFEDVRERFISEMEDLRFIRLGPFERR